MIDYQRVVEFLRDFRAVPGQPVTDELRRYATEYARYCASANERLRQCSVFLQQGLRSEAVHQADESPNLLEMVAALDLPEPQEWVEFCQQNELPAPPPLQIDRAGQLNDAYGQTQPVEAMMKQHRRLALSRASIKQRLAVMRQVASLDGGGFWEKDIATFEKARLKELKVAFATAMETHDATALASLSEEVLATAWLEAPPDDLMAAARGTDDRLKRITATEKLNKLLVELRAGFAARDHATCSRLLKKIPQIAAEGNQAGVSKDIATELKPISAWVRQEDDLENLRIEAVRSQRQLGEALDADAPQTQLESIYQKLRAGQQAIPVELEARYQGTIGRLRSKSWRSYALIVMGVVSVLALGAFGIYHYSRIGLARGWANRIHQAVANHDVALARQVAQEQEKRAADFNNDPLVASAKRELEKLEQNQSADTATLQALLTRLQNCQGDAEMALKNPDAEIQSLLAESRTAQQVAIEGAQVLNSGDQLAWVDPDHRLASGVQQLQNNANALKEMAQAKARNQTIALTKRVDGLALSMANKGMDQAARELDAIASDADSLRQINGVSPETLSALSALTDTISAKRTSLAKDMEMAERLMAMRSHGTSPDAWKKELQGFVAAYPNAPQSSDFARAAELTDALAALDALGVTETGWIDQPSVSTEAAAKARLDKIKDYLGRFPQSPFLPAIIAYSDYLQQAADALALKGSWAQSFQQLLSSPLLTDLKFLTDSSGHRYFVMGDIDIRTMRFNDQMRISFKVIDPADLTKRKTVSLAPPLALTDATPTSFPHTVYAQALATRLKQVGPENWDTVGITLIEDLRRDDKLDPVVRAIFLNQALKSTLQIAGWGLAEVYEPAARDLARQDVENIVWYDPANPVASSTLDALKHISESIPRSDAALKALRERRAKIFTDVICRYEGTGILLKDEQGQWMVFTNGSPPAGSTAWMVGIAPKEGTPPSLVLVATLKEGKFIVDESAARQLPQGTLLYFKKP